VRTVKREKEKGLSGGRHPLRPVGLVIGLAVMSLFSGWWTYPANAVEEGIPGVSIEVSFDGLDVAASSSAPIPVELDQAATVTVSVLETGTSTTPLVIDDPSVLLELEYPSGSRTRFADWEQASETEYHTDLTFSEPGPWRLVALPDLEDRSLMVPGSTDVVVVTVEEPWFRARRVRATSACFSSVGCYCSWRCWYSISPVTSCRGTTDPRVHRFLETPGGTARKPQRIFSHPCSPQSTTSSSVSPIWRVQSTSIDDLGSR
jgi:hypothetical protein